jgi:hypothetical protein
MVAEGNFTDEQKAILEGQIKARIPDATKIDAAAARQALKATRQEITAKINQLATIDTPEALDFAALKINYMISALPANPEQSRLRAELDKAHDNAQQAITKGTVYAPKPTAFTLGDRLSKESREQLLGVGKGTLTPEPRTMPERQITTPVVMPQAAQVPVTPALETVPEAVVEAPRLELPALPEVPAPAVPAPAPKVPAAVVPAPAPIPAITAEQIAAEEEAAWKPVNTQRAQAQAADEAARAQQIEHAWNQYETEVDLEGVRPVQPEALRPDNKAS